MRLENISIRNFRLLRRLSLDLAADSTATILVGPNNSGKTSVMDALRVFGAAGAKAPEISFHDLSQLRHRDLRRLEALLSVVQDGTRKAEIVRRRAPRMRIDLTFSYTDDPADLIAATDLLMDLTPGSNRVRLRIDYAVKNAKQLVDDFEARPVPAHSLCDFLKESFGRYYERVFYKVSADGSEAIELKDGAALKRLLKVDVVPAQRHVDDDDSSRSAKLSRLLHDHYTRFYKVDNADGYQQIENALSTSAGELTQSYGQAFGRLTKRLQDFGYPQGQTKPDLRVRAQMTAETIYRDNARIFYASQHLSAAGVMEEFELPEKYNGLGYKNLIYIVLQLESFRATIDAAPEERPRVHIIAIEEPEAHLHPQMQSVFVGEISKALESDGGTTAQVLLSTHSTHMIARAEFTPIRYFRRAGRQVYVKDLSQLPLPPTMPDLLEFLRRYIRLTHFDLFFADKVILIEGQVERLLMPLMIEACAKLEGCGHFESQYVSISEIGGAYAHKFQPLIEFLGIPTLIITDLDAVDAEGKKCPVATGAGTSNVALRDWLPGRPALTELRACDETAKTQGAIRVAYQVEEGGHCGRSFEEAFIYANTDWLTKNHEALSSSGKAIKKSIDAGLQDDAWNLSGKLSKVDFALDLLSCKGWATPKYIEEGLIWLAQCKAASA